MLVARYAIKRAVICMMTRYNQETASPQINSLYVHLGKTIPPVVPGIVKRPFVMRTSLATAKGGG